MATTVKPRSEMSQVLLKKIKTFIKSNNSGRVGGQGARGVQHWAPLRADLLGAQPCPGADQLPQQQEVAGPHQSIRPVPFPIFK